MSILEGVFGDKESMAGAIEFATQMTQEMLPELDEKTRHVIEATADGTSLGDVLGVTKEQKRALLDTGCRLVQMGQFDKATDVLLRLVQLDPLEERAFYALAIVCQMRGELHKAAQMLLQFLALDATNPMGYLRLGECLLKAGEHVEAHSAFTLAKEFADEGKGQPGNAEEARHMLNLPEMIAAAGSARQ